MAKTLSEKGIIGASGNLWFEEPFVKKFIKDVKKLGWRFYNQRITWKEYLEELNKLVGDNLIDKS